MSGFYGNQVVVIVFGRLFFNIFSCQFFLIFFMEFLIKKYNSCVLLRFFLLPRLRTQYLILLDFRDFVNFDFI